MQITLLFLTLNLTFILLILTWKKAEQESWWSHHSLLSSHYHLQAIYDVVLFENYTNARNRATFLRKNLKMYFLCCKLEKLPTWVTAYMYGLILLCFTTEWCFYFQHIWFSFDSCKAVITFHTHTDKRQRYESVQHNDRHRRLLVYRVSKVLNKPNPLVKCLISDRRTCLHFAFFDKFRKLDLNYNHSFSSGL